MQILCCSLVSGLLRAIGRRRDSISKKPMAADGVRRVAGADWLMKEYLGLNISLDVRRCAESVPDTAFQFPSRCDRIEPLGAQALVKAYLFMRKNPQAHTAQKFYIAI